MDLETLITFVLASFTLTISPGPDILYVISQSIIKGRKSAFMISLGLTTGLLVHTFLVAIGLSVIISQNENILNIIKLLSVFYFFYLIVLVFLKRNDNLKQNEDGLVERSFNKTLNFNNQADINEIIETFKPEKIFQLKPLNIGNDLIIDLPNELKGNFNNTKLVLKDGTEVPDWLEYDPVTGQIIAENPPEDVSQLELKLIIEQDGKIIVKDLEVDLQEQNVSQNFDGGENNKFVTLSDQLDKEFNDWEDYGNDLINRL